VLATLIEAYEREYYVVDVPEPVEPNPSPLEKSQARPKQGDV
jgi:antitoxin component HigA of HigAB toxin-antitoxin module